MATTGTTSLDLNENGNFDVTVRDGLTETFTEVSRERAELISARSAP